MYGGQYESDMVKYAYPYINVITSTILFDGCIVMRWRDDIGLTTDSLWSIALYLRG